MATFPYRFRNQTLQIEQRKNTQKNIILRAVSHDTLRIGTPKWFGPTQLRSWLDGHHDFIAQTLAKAAHSSAAKQQMPSEIWYRGRLLPLTEHGGKTVLLTGNTLYLPPQDWPQQQTALQRFLKQQAAEILLPRLSLHAAEQQLPLGKSALSSAKTFWGVCRKQDIRLNWRLIGAPDFVIDYVCIHELCHILHADHSPAFWQAVTQRTPHTVHAKQWLKEYGNKLFAVG